MHDFPSQFSISSFPNSFQCKRCTGASGVAGNDSDTPPQQAAKLLSASIGEVTCFRE